MIPNKLLSKWMEFIRENPEHAQRFTECFWPSQLRSKSVALDMLAPDLAIYHPYGSRCHDIYIFGGWYGVFAQLFASRYANCKIHNIDVDPSCEFVFNKINIYPQITHTTDNMATFKYPTKPTYVINTSTEHVTQETYDIWWNNIPSGTKYLIQSNNFFALEEHIRCSDTMDEFLDINHLQDNNEWVKEIDCGMRSDGEPFIRFMAIGVK